MQRRAPFCSVCCHGRYVGRRLDRALLCIDKLDRPEDEGGGFRASRTAGEEEDAAEVTEGTAGRGGGDVECRQTTRRGASGSGASEGSGSWDVPFELVGEVARAGTMAKARDVERLTAARHVVVFRWKVLRKKG